MTLLNHDPAIDPAPSMETAAGPDRPALNTRQQAAVDHGDGPLLVFAGAGSGKTLVITQRIVNLVMNRGVSPYQIIALTFTNKAANEMRERIGAALGPLAERIWISTFHAACARILRRDAELIGLPSSFVIFDAADQRHLLKRVLAELQINPRQFPERNFANHISRLKRELKAPESVQNSGASFGIQRHLGAVYRAYQRSLQENGAVDFDDLLGLTIRLWEEHPATMATYRDRLRHVLVDEYQDTNQAQWRLIDLLVREHKNLCVVGDDDQSIYRWRGAEVGNILEFSRHYPGAQVITLAENYRSSQIILSAASAVVARNAKRHPKDLFTNRGGGEKIALFDCVDEEEEASCITAGVRHFHAREGIAYAEIAVFFRTNAQSRVVEDGLRRASIPYQVVGGLKFYDRKEVKDLLAYMRIIANPLDSVSLRRIINVPQRGIGSTTIERLHDYARETATSLLDAVRRAARPEAGQDEIVGKAAHARLRQFIDLYDELRGVAARESAAETLREIMRLSGYLDALEKEASAQADSRRENLHELISAAADFERETEGEDARMQDFLDHAALVSTQDAMSDESGAVTLMTLHASKGLEFDTVFMAGMEDGLFPHERVMYSTAELEEERRLCYVGMTRAKNRLLMSWAETRRVAGVRRASPRSLFLDDLPAECVAESAPIWHPSPSRYRSGSRQQASFSQRSAYGAYRSARSVESGDVDAVPSATSNTKERYYEYEPGEGPADHAGYQRGAQVRHPTFGLGWVREVSGSGDRLKVTVEFDDVGRKKLMVKYAALEFVEPLD